MVCLLGCNFIMWHYLLQGIQQVSVQLYSPEEWIQIDSGEKMCSRHWQFLMLLCVFGLVTSLCLIVLPHILVRKGLYVLVVAWPWVPYGICCWHSCDIKPWGGGRGEAMQQPFPYLLYISFLATMSTILRIGSVPYGIYCTFICCSSRQQVHLDYGMT